MSQYRDLTEGETIRIGDEFWDVGLKVWHPTYDATQLPNGLKYRRPIEAKPHNPDGLTPEQVGVSEGWRLLDEDEIRESTPIAVIRMWTHLTTPHGWTAGGVTAGELTEYTYRTKLNRADLRKARGLEPKPEPETRQTPMTPDERASINEFFMTQGEATKGEPKATPGTRDFLAAVMLENKRLKESYAEEAQLLASALEQVERWKHAVEVAEANYFEEARLHALTKGELADVRAWLSDQSITAAPLVVEDCPEMQRLTAEVEKLTKSLQRNAEDWAADDTKIKELCGPHCKDVDGDSFSVPGMIDVVEEAIGKLEAENAKLRQELAEQKANCARLMVGIDSMKLAVQNADRLYADYENTRNERQARIDALEAEVARLRGLLGEIDARIIDGALWIKRADGDAITAITDNGNCVWRGVEREFSEEEWVKAQPALAEGGNA